MSWLKLSDVAVMTNGTLLGADVALNAVSIDTRKAKSGDLFIAIKGERFDAHDFVAGLMGKVAGAIVSQEVPCDVPQVLVEDTRLALAELASAWREHYKNPVIGLTGSNGKTTLKEMVAAILTQQGNVLATAGNFNNDIGMPLTLLRMRKEHDFAVIEMGANHFGEIRFLAEIAKPDIAVVNNAGSAHLEGFGTVEGVAKEKGEIFSALTENGVAVINGDDEYADYWLGLNTQQVGRKTVLFSMEKMSQTNGRGDCEGCVSGDYLGNGRLLIRVNSAEQEVQLNLLGKHNAMNALAATAVATAVGVDLQTVKKGLESVASVPGRLERVEGIAGTILLDDTYNANPASIQAAIDVLVEGSDTRILVLGDLGELGGDANEIHADIGVKAKLSGIEKMFCLGKHSAKACEQFGSPGNAFSELDMLVDALKKEINDTMNSTINSTISGTKNDKMSAPKNMTILIKGSRSAQMERVVEALRDTGSTASC